MSDRIVEILLNEFKSKKTDCRKNDGEKNDCIVRRMRFLEWCIDRDAEYGEVIRSLYVDGRSFRATARNMHISRGAVEYHKKMAVRRYAERFEIFFKTS
jgi:DNA-directed RNA polymerase specialized sigma24 family protein